MLNSASWKKNMAFSYLALSEMHWQVFVDRITVSLALHASTWSTHVKHLLWNARLTLPPVIYAIARYVEDTAVKPGHEKESEVKDFCDLTQQLLWEFAVFQAVWFHFRGAGEPGAWIPTGSPPGCKAMQSWTIYFLDSLHCTAMAFETRWVSHTLSSKSF